MSTSRILVMICILLVSSFLFAQDETRLLRFPTTNGQQIVFAYAFDLYTVPVNGGTARKLTSFEGDEMYPRFSPDGKQLAFTGQYDGNTEVFLMPAQGGVPQRITYTATLGRDDVSDRMGPNNLVITWKNTTPEIVFRSRMRSFNSFNGQLYTVNTTGNLPQQIEVPRGGFCSFSPDDKKMAYNRVFREYRTWKRYRGGMADDVWIYDFTTKQIENITNNPAQDIIPMWTGNKIYFLSDRDKRMNLYSYDLTSKTTKQHTTFTDFDIKFPSLGKDAIVFEQAGYIWRFDLASETFAKVPIKIAEDFSVSRGGIEEVGGNVSNFEISPDGKRALFGARGDVFTVPAEHGPTRNLTATSGVHERNSKWSPDGKWIAFISDQSGENEIYVVAQDGKGEPRQVTKGADTYYYQIYWSPDSKKLLWGDKKQRLRYVDVASGKITEVANATAWEIRQYAWSPDSRWIAYAMPEEEGMNTIRLYSLADGKNHQVTEGWYAANSPAFSNDGKYLLFASSRDFNPIYSWTEWNHAYQDMERVYLVTLSKDTPSPFQPKSDEVAIKADEPKKDDGKGKKDKKDEKEDEKKELVVKVDLEGLSGRVIGLSIQASSYGNLACIDDVVYYNRNGSKDQRPQLVMYDLKKEKETELGQVNGYEISADNKKMLFSQNGKYAIIDLPKGPVKMDETLDLAGMEVHLDRHAEWQQIFNEAWRQMRDFFYAPNMHGVDWEAQRVKYGALVPYVNHRKDLTYIIGEMIGELNVGHAYVGGGEFPTAKRIQMGLLGAELSRDPASKYYRIEKILEGENWDNSNRSPLRDIGVHVNEGDYILAVNGESTNQMDNIYAALVNTPGKQVVLTVNGTPNTAGSRTVTVLPIRDESGLYYYNWVQDNIAKVDKATGGKVGYIHIPDMGPNGLNEFVKHFYPQLRKKALIIDVRGNGGGNVSPMLIERLRREIAMVTMARNTSPGPNPGDMMVGPMVCLLNEFSASDGDLFPYRFKQHKMGKLIGKRSWGGVVGIRGSLPLLDGGFLNKPEFSRYDLAGKTWVIEGVGVEPDIYVDNDPYKEFSGEDQQLERAIKEIMDELKTKEWNVPPIPSYPDKH
ncbi:MAG: PD40 domain-containing protein [Calditrichaeota bacterium]|nr:PD40 domain-containing protein [Calditrichota bacterium]MCB9090270.1 PD40 domain-containing protein [Calditrichia bacterium]